jgi:serine/threonine protein kinase, bacterial
MRKSLLIIFAYSFFILFFFNSCSSEDKEIVVDKSYKTVTTLAGIGTTGSVDGIGIQASFWGPEDIVVDNSGNLYVADRGNSKIRKIAPDGTVSTFAEGFEGSVDGIAIDSSGNLYIANTGNDKIQKITPSGVVTVLAGSGTGSMDGDISQASFYCPTDVAVDVSGNVFVVDSCNNKIRKITPSGMVSTFAGTGTTGSDDGKGILASFNAPHSITIDVSGNIYVTEWGNNKIRKIAPDGVVTTLVGGNTTNSSADGTGANAGFSLPTGIVADISGNLYVADSNNDKIRKVSSSGVVTTFVGTGKPGSNDGLLSVASFNKPFGIAIDNSGHMYIADKLNQKIRKILFE